VYINVHVMKEKSQVEARNITIVTASGACRHITSPFLSQITMSATSRSSSPIASPSAPSTSEKDKASISKINEAGAAEDNENAGTPEAQESDASRDDRDDNSEDEDDKDASDASARQDSAEAKEGAASSTTPSAGDWQAIFSPAHNAYYFYNGKTQETTWTNPLESSPDASTSTSISTPEASTSQASVPPHLAQMYAAQAAAASQGIDPSLAHLDPSLAGASGPGGGGVYAATAKFNARTGAFAKVDARAPEHLSEFERAKRMSEFYFDVNAWEQDVAKRHLEEAQEEESRKKKRPSKTDLVSRHLSLRR
jgi:hypothetical protein